MKRTGLDTSGEATHMSGCSGDDVAAAGVLAELSTPAGSAPALAEILQRTAELTRTLVGSAAEVSMTLLSGEHARTPVTTAKWAASLDEVQYQQHGGPCLDAARTGRVVLIADTASDQRWPAFAEAATRSGVGSSLSVPLPVNGHVTGSLNVYAAETKSLDAGRIRLAEQFASYAALAIANTGLYLVEAKHATQMAEAMASRAVIEQAKGILMAVHRCEEDKAFSRLVSASQRNNRKLREVARELVQRATRQERTCPARPDEARRSGCAGRSPA